MVQNKSKFGATHSQFSLRTAYTASLVVAVLSLSACGSLGTVFGSKPVATSDMPAEVLYKAAKSELEASSWTNAIEAMEKVQAADAMGIYGQQALLDTAYAQWRNGDNALGLASVERYLRQFPKSEGVPYALYLKGLINFNERSGLVTSITKEDLSERDLKSLQESYAAFERLLKQYPSSQYSKEAAQRLPYIVNTLAKHEVNVALFYLQNNAPVAAVGRVQEMLKLYPQSPSQEVGLGIMAEAYRQLGLSEPRENALRVLKQNYPNSPHLADNARELYKAPSKSWFSFW
jgi:outer membrane protein assembly factor BamD